MIGLFKHNIEEKAIEDCIEVLRSGWHTSGPIGEEVEKLIADYYNAGFGPQDFQAVLTSSCTSALISTAMVIGLKEGDEVITTPTTFIATSASFMIRGATPVYVDIDPSTGLIDVDKVEEKITDKTKAIWMVNLFGHMPDIVKLREIADRHNLFLLEDCAHAFDAIRDGYRPGTHSHAACYSFYATKNTHCGEGGAIITRDPKLAQKVKEIRRHGMSQFPKPGSLGNMGYDIVRLGFKGNLSDISASLLKSQISKTIWGDWQPDFYREIRNEIAAQYTKIFSGLQRVQPVLPDEGVKSSWYTYPLLVKTPELRESLRETLRTNMIGHTVMYQSIETFTLFDNHPVTCPNAVEFAQRQVSIPCYPKLTYAEIELIINTIRDWDKAQ